MKALKFIAIFLALFTAFLNAKDSNYMEKIVKLYNLKTNGAIEFNITKTKDGYDLYPTSLNKIYSEIFSKKAMHIVVDDGPIVTKPKFTLATAGLTSKGSVLDFFNPELTKDANKTLKSGANYKYEAVVSFGDELEEKTYIEPIVIENSDISIKTSKIISKSNFDLNSFTGKSTFKIDEVVVKPKNEKVILELKGIEAKADVTQEPIDNIMLFAKNSLSAKSVYFNAKDKSGKTIKAKFSLNMYGETKRVDREFMDLGFGYDIKALDTDTIALSKGIKESNLDIEFKNLGIKGLVEFLKLSKELDELNDKLYSAVSSNNDKEMQTIIIKQQEIANRAVDIFNKTFIADKSRVVLDLDLISDKKSFVKLNMLYKGKPISGNIQNAMITLMAQQLALFDGSFEVQLDSSLASSVNPFAIMGLDLLKAKGFATVKDGVYHLKGELKGGKIVINGKAYTLPELTKALF